MKGKMVYFAFGMNTNFEQMAMRCPTAELLGKAHVEDYRLVFRGVADIVPSPGDRVFGALWLLDIPCLKALDRLEGYPRLYGKDTVLATLTETKRKRKFVALAYVMRNDRTERPPSEHYYECIRDGFFHLGHDAVARENLDCAALSSRRRDLWDG